jgi:hypothetical protein
VRARVGIADPNGALHRAGRGFVGRQEKEIRGLLALASVRVRASPCYQTICLAGTTVPSGSTGTPPIRPCDSCSPSTCVSRTWRGPSRSRAAGARRTGPSPGRSADGPGARQASEPACSWRRVPARNAMSSSTPAAAAIMANPAAMIPMGEEWGETGGRHHCVAGRVQDVPGKVFPSWTSQQARSGVWRTNGCVPRSWSPGREDRRRSQDGRALGLRARPLPAAPVRGRGAAGRRRGLPVARRAVPGSGVGGVGGRGSRHLPAPV